MNVGGAGPFQSCDKLATHWYQHDEDVCSYCDKHDYQCGQAISPHGVWWNIAGAGWVSALPEHHNQLEMFPCPKGSSYHTPKWGGKALLFTKETATKLAAEWTAHGSPYEARPIHETAQRRAT
jgi:hypothetical protein